MLALLTGIAAGVGEEIAYRGVLFQLLQAISSSFYLSLVLCVVLFAWSHLVQGKKAVYGIGVLGLCFHVLFFATGTLAVPIGVHALYDMTMFTLLYRREKRLAGRGAEPPKALEQDA
jgi:membrane protease YdiL (CAAX protease family)